MPSSNWSRRTVSIKLVRLLCHCGAIQSAEPGGIRPVDNHDFLVWGVVHPQHASPEQDANPSLFSAKSAELGRIPVDSPIPVEPASQKQHEINGVEEPAAAMGKCNRSAKG